MPKPAIGIIWSLPKLALRFIWRDWKGGELALLAGSLMVAVAMVSAISFFVDRLEQALLSGGATLLAADRVIRGSHPIPDAWQQEASRYNLKRSRTMAFPSMARTDQGQQQLVAVKAVDDGYPLRGQLQIADAPFAAGKVTSRLPEAGTVWLDSRLFPALGLALGDWIRIGRTRLRITQALISEPDKGGNVFGLGPRLLMRYSDVPAAGLIQPGSRANYSYLLSGSNNDLEAFRAWLTPQLDDSAYRWLDIKAASPSIRSTLERAESFLLLGGLVGVILAALSIGLMAARYSRRHFNQVAILKTLGLKPLQVVWLYLLNLLIIALAAVLCGIGLAWVVQELLVRFLGELIPVELPPPGLSAVWTGIGTGFICLFAFALPPILALKDISPLRVIHRDLQSNLSARSVYGLGAIGILGLLIWYSRSLQLTLWILLSAALICTIILLLMGLAAKFALRRGMRAGHPWHLALTGMRRRYKESGLQVIAFSISVLLILLLVLVRTELITDWQAQIPERAANHFLINVAAEERSAVRELLTSELNDRPAFFPSLRGRMTHIGGEPIAERQARFAFTTPSDIDGTEERNLTWSEALPAENQIVAGQWWQAAVKRPTISLEQNIAQVMGAQIGEIVRFQIADRVIEAEIASIRALRWDNFRPNFYIIFAPGTLEALPGSWMTSFYLAPENKIFLNRLLSQFPTVTVIEVDALIAQVQRMIRQVVLAVEWILVMVLIAGALALIASIRSNLDVRRREYAVLFTLGASTTRLRIALLIEFSVLGIFAGLMAAITSEGAAFFLWREIFLLAPAWHPHIWWAGPLLSWVLMTLIGYGSTHALLRTSPMEALRQN